MKRRRRFLNHTEQACEPSSARHPHCSRCCVRHGSYHLVVSQTQSCFGGCSVLALTDLRTALKQKAPTPCFSRNCHLVFRAVMAIQMYLPKGSMRRQHLTRSHRAALQDSHIQLAGTAHLTKITMKRIKYKGQRNNS